MPTVKIKTEPTAATAAVDVQVKLEPSLSAGDIKHEQHTSDIDTKVESDSEADSEEDDIKSENDDNSDDGDTNQATAVPKNQKQFICKHPGCGRSFNYAGNLRVHQREHRLQTDINICGKAHILTRQSLTNRWPCPVPDCTSTYKTVGSVCRHIRKSHGDIIGQQQPQQQLPANMNQRKYNSLDVDEYYVDDIRCGYHATTGVFICHECRLVPECLLTHLQQKHGYDEESIDNAMLPESAVNARADPSCNQHTDNPHLASAIRNPYQQQHPDIVQGWLCVAPNCGHCCSTKGTRYQHQRREHKGEQQSTVPALLLRLLYGKIQTSCFLITRLDTSIDNNIKPNDSTVQYNSECDADDGDELVLSDYSD